MVRSKSNLFGTINNGKSPTKKTRKSGDNSCSDLSATSAHGVDFISSTVAVDSASGETIIYHPIRTSVHKQNFYIVSYPIIFLFNILRTLLYQLFIIFKYIFTASSRIVYRPVVLRKDCSKLEIVTDDGHNKVCEAGEEIIQMSTVPKQGPGPGDPLLAKQKHHHRRAFEYISKALKIDEENEGMMVCISFYMVSNA